MMGRKADIFNGNVIMESVLGNGHTKRGYGFATKPCNFRIQPGEYKSS